MKIVNVSGEPKELDVQLKGETIPDDALGILTILSGEKQDANGLNGEKVTPIRTEIRFDNGSARVTLPEYAAVVIVCQKEGQ